jgi:hypothetical protein
MRKGVNIKSTKRMPDGTIHVYQGVHLPESEYTNSSSKMPTTTAGVAPVAKSTSSKNPKKTKKKIGLSAPTYDMKK